ncbi:hypothetical protein BC2926_33510 [Bacillus cereus]|nr:hypothetical protein BC2926_33510 [Bacillus cereus]
MINKTIGVMKKAINRNRFSKVFIFTVPFEFIPQLKTSSIKLSMNLIKESYRSMYRNKKIAGYVVKFVYQYSQY